MDFISLNKATHHYRYTPADGVPVVFLNSLGTDFRIWDGVIDAFDDKGPTLCLDKRGHVLSDDAPISMDILIQDVAALMDHLGLSGAVICGVSVGGMIAQGLAASRPDLVSGLILCCTGAKIGDPGSWNKRIQAVQNNGLDSIADAVMERWFSASFAKHQPAAFAGYRNMLIRTSSDGYAGVCGAICDADLTGRSRNIAVPTHIIAGAYDLATPPALVRALADLVSGASFETLDDCGHLPCIQHPQAVASAITKMRRQLQ